jgi:hypothetical protein
MKHAHRLRAAPHLKWPSPLCVLIALAEARALLYAANEFDLPDAVDPLQAFAVESGLIDDVGQDAVQRILATAFSQVQHAFRI